MVLNYDASWWMFWNYFWTFIILGKIIQRQNSQNPKSQDFRCVSVVGRSRLRIKKIKSKQSFTYTTYINAIVSHIVAPPCVKDHAEVASAELAATLSLHHCCYVTQPTPLTEPLFRLAPLGPLKILAPL